MKKIQFLFLGFYFSIVALFLYSYTQVDLSLTLSKVSIYQTVEKLFQYIGYFNRPLSTIFYLIIVVLLFVLYFLFLKFAKKINVKNIWLAIILTAIILTFSYNAFSYDLFNYIFDAKILTHYHLNPYLHKALDFPTDPMLSFMHWTQRNYPYGPFWLLLTVPLSVIGFNYFLPTFFLFKILASVSYLGSAYLIYKIAKKLNKDANLALIAFAFNPLTIIEVLVSAHNDIEMMFFGLLAIYLLIKMKYWQSSLSLIFSIGIKFATGFLAPLFIINGFFLKKKNWDNFFIVSYILMFLAVIAATFRSTFQPWYLLDIIPFAALIPNKKYILIATFIFSIVALLNYVPFLFTGNWDVPIPNILIILNLSGILGGLLMGIIFRKS